MYYCVLGAFVSELPRCKKVVKCQFTTAVSMARREVRDHAHFTITVNFLCPAHKRSQAFSVNFPRLRRLIDVVLARALRDCLDKCQELPSALTYNNTNINSPSPPRLDSRSTRLALPRTASRSTRFSRLSHVAGISRKSSALTNHSLQLFTHPTLGPCL